jgi:hypothetical protein
MTGVKKNQFAPKEFSDKPDRGISDCEGLIRANIDASMRVYHKAFEGRDKQLIEKMDELINIVRKEYTVNRVLIYIQFAIDFVLVALVSYLFTKR